MRSAAGQARGEVRGSAGGAGPGGAQQAYGAVVEQVRHRQALNTSRDGVPQPVGAVTAAEAAVEERLDGDQLSSRQGAGAPGDVCRPGCLVHRPGPAAVLAAPLVDGGA